MIAARKATPATTDQPNDVEILTDRILAASGIDQTRHITIVGQHAIMFLLELCRRGFSHVTCRTADSRNGAGEERSHSLWIVNVSNEAELLGLAGAFGRYLQANGNLVLVFEETISPAQSLRFREVLSGAGFVAHRETWDRWGRPLLFFRKHRSRPHIAAQAA